MRAWRVHRTDDVDLVILERNIVLVDVDYMVRIVYPESNETRKEKEEGKLKQKLIFQTIIYYYYY